MHVLIIGGGGFLGQRLARELLAKGGLVEGALRRMTLLDKTFTEIKADSTLLGGDGLIVVNNNELIVITNRAAGLTNESVYALKTTDNWKTVKTLAKQQFDPVYLTTGVIKQNKIYVIYSHLNELISATNEARKQLQYKAVIQQVGVVQ